MDEIQWKSVTDLKGDVTDFMRLHEFRPYYEISNTGLVRNKNTGKLLSLEESKDSYRRVAMRVKDGKTETSTRKIHLHKLVALAFIGEPKSIKMQADHIDRDRSHNHVKNLRWLSGSDNCKNKTIHGRQKKTGKLWFDGKKIYYREKDFRKFCTNRDVDEYEYNIYLERLDIENNIVFENEEWKDLEYKGQKFTVSNRGRIHLKHYGKNTFGTPCDAGYMNITNQGVTCRVHRLIALAFLSNEFRNLSDGLENPEKDLVVNHKDNYGNNNNIENLEWVSISDNLSHAIKIGAKKTRRVTRKSHEDIKEYPSIQSAVDELGHADKKKSRKAIEACLKANSIKDIPTHFSQGYIWYYSD